ncbi:MAG: Crp/Fnr family transcriptional regulator [Pseudomonadota bacterium]
MRSIEVTAQPIQMFTRLRGVGELRRMYLFSHLEPEDFDKVASSMQVHRLEKDQRLFDQGQKARRFFVVRRGRIKLFLLSAEGEEKIVHIEHPGFTFGEAVMFMDKPVYPVSAEAVQASELYSFDNKTFLGVLRHNSETCFRLMGSMSMRLRWHVSEIENLCLHNATFRLVTYLLRKVPESAQENTNVQLSIPKVVLASRLSIKRETLSRILARLRSQGLIDVLGQDIILRDLQALRNLLI